MDWIESLDQKDLLALIPKDYRELAELDPEKAAKQLVAEYRTDGLVSAFKAPKKASKKSTPPKNPQKVAKTSAVSRPQYGSLWQGIKAEFYLLVCTNNSKYAPVQKSINQHGASITIMAVSTIAAAIAAALGVTAGVVVPVVSIFLLAVSKVGMNAWCGLAPAGSQNKAGQAKKKP